MSHYINTVALVTGLFYGLSLQAQSDYKVDIGESTYIPLNEGTQLNEGPWPAWHSYAHVPIGFDVKFFDREFSSFKLEVSSRMVFDDTHQYFFDPLAIVSLVDAGMGSAKAKSVLLYHTEGSVGDRIFTIEYRDVRLAADTSHFVSFQTRIFEGSGIFEFHMGPNSQPNTSLMTLGPYSGIYHLNSVSPTIEFASGTNLMGNPAAPTVKRFSGTNNPYLTYTLSALPVQGTLYRFTPEAPIGMKEPDVQPNMVWRAADEVLYIQNNDHIDIRIFNIQGTLIEKHRPSAMLSLRHLEQGAYFIKQGTKTLKVIKT